METYTPYSGLKIFRHTNCINGLVKGERVAPIYIRVKPTNVCNQKCYYCAYADNQLYDGRKVGKKESIPWEVFRDTIQEMADMGVKAVTFSGGGEPLCYSYINQALEMVRAYGIEYSMITNGQALHGEVVEYLEGAKWVRVSLDAYDAQTYQAIRGVSTHDEVVRNIKNFARRKGRCVLGINCVVTKQNAGQIYDICNLAKELGVDNIKLSPLQIKGARDYHASIQDSVLEQICHAKDCLETEDFVIVDKYTESSIADGNFQKSYHRCVIQEMFAVIAADSKIYRCHQRAYTKPGEIGDLLKQSLKEIWYSQEAIKKVREFDPFRECPFPCAFDERNIMLNEFLELDDEHINFI